VYADICRGSSGRGQTTVGLSKSVIFIVFVAEIGDYSLHSPVWTGLNGVDVHWPGQDRLTIPVYNALSLRLSVHRDCLTRSSNTRTFSQLSLRVLFIITIRLYVGSE